jgi:WD40 repeat protein
MIAQEKADGLFGGLVSTYSAVQNLLLTGSQAGNYIKSWNVEDGIQAENIRAWNISGLQGSYDGTHSLTISPDGQYVFSWSGLEGVANLWEIGTQKRAMTIKIPRSEYSQYQPGFYPVALSPDNTKLVFSYSLHPELHLSSVYSVPDGAELYQISNYYAVFSPNGSVIAASVGNNQIRFYDSQTGKALGDLTSIYPNQNGFQLLYFSEDGKSLIAVSTNGTISIWGIP